MAKEKDPNPPAEKELTLSGIQGMKKADIIKEFKAMKTTWTNPSKCTAVIFLLAFNKNLDKKKVTIAIPFKKDMDMRQQFKEIKAKKIHSMQKVAAGLITIDKEKKEAIVELTNGGAKEEALLKAGGKLFDLLKLTLKVKLAAGYEAEQPDPSEAPDDDEEEALSAEEATPAEDEEDEAPKVDTGLIEQMKASLIDVAGKMKSQVQAVVMGNVKSKNASEDDLDIVQKLQKQIADLRKMYDGAADNIKKAFASNAEAIFAYLPSLDKIKAAIEGLLGSSGADTADPEANKRAEELKKQWENLQKEMDAMTGSIAKAVEDLKKTAGEAIEGGKDLLKKLF